MRARRLHLLQGSRDRFEQLLVSLIADNIGVAYAQYYRLRFEEIDGKTVCVVEADPVREGVFLKSDKGRSFMSVSATQLACSMQKKLTCISNHVVAKYIVG